MRKYWKCGGVEITICGAIVLIEVYRWTFSKVGRFWNFTNATVDDE